MAEDTDRVEGDGAAKGGAGDASPPPPAGVPVGEYPPGYKWHGPDVDGSTSLMMSPESPLTLREGKPVVDDASDVVIRIAADRYRKFHADTESGPTTPLLPLPPEPSASTSPSVVQLSGRTMAMGSGRASPTVTVARASGDPAERTVVLERNLSERPEDIREAARALSKAVTDQIDFLNDNKANEPDPLARHNDLIAFFTRIAEQLDAFADAIDVAINAASSSEREPVLLGGAASIARSIGDFVREGLTTHRAALQACAIQVPVISLSAWLLQQVGFDPKLAFTAIAAIMGVKLASKKE
jgi:hypothetical protein